MATPRILVVEDDLGQREALAELLRMRGYGVNSCGNGLEALRSLERDPQLADAILLDLTMPVMNGWEFLEHKRNHPQLKSIEVVVLTGDHYTTRPIVLPEAAALLKKPVIASELLETLDWVVAERPCRHATVSLAGHGTSRLDGRRHRRSGTERPGRQKSRRSARSERHPT